MTDLDVVKVQPLETIQMWSGLLIDIPQGWQLCDGTNGTPNLIDRFIQGASVSQDPGTIGGEKNHTLSNAEMPNHTHGTFGTGGGFHSHKVTNEPDYRNRIALVDARGSPGGGGQAVIAGWVVKAGLWTIGSTGGASHQNRPSYFELAFIQRLA